jgi:hypothetical protein
MKNSKNFMLLLAAGAAYYYFAIYLKNKNKVQNTMMQKDLDIQTAMNRPNVPLIEVAPPRLQPYDYQSDVVDRASEYNVKYTMSGYRRLGKMPNTI